MKYFVTGHTGFKGAWLTLLLHELGHEIHGYALDPIRGSLFERAQLRNLCYSDMRADIRDAKRLSQELARVSPDVIIHLAAQPLVRYGYEHPEETFTTNFNGTLNLLSASAALSDLKALVVITTDKVYKNTGKPEGYVEEDPLGGLDPYSASKSAADILSQSWSHVFPSLPIVIARAGNVLGGGDNSKDRLVPDLIRAFSNEKIGKVRNPKSVRPWQHVLDCLNGYLSLAESAMYSGVRGAWNFSPASSSFQTVSTLADSLARYWGGEARWEATVEEKSPHEDGFLVLNSRKAERELNWSNKYGFDQTLSDIVAWEQGSILTAGALELSKSSLDAFLKS